MLFFATTIDGLQMGLCFAVLALGVYISYSILDFPDLSVDGTFPLGGVCCTVLMLKLGVPALIAVFLSFFAGVIAGAVTGILHVKFNISKLLSGIIVMTALLSVTLALTKLLTKTGFTTTIFSFRSENLTGIFSGKTASLLGNANRDYMIILIELIFVIAVKVIIDLFLKTKLGYMLKATGDNEMLVASLGKDNGTYKILGIALANGFSAMSGALYSNLYSQYDNSCGSGKVVMALASVIIGMAVFSKIRFFADTTAVILGAVIYSLCLNYLVLVDTNGIYLKLLNAVMFALILIFNEKTAFFTAKHRKLKRGKSKC
ncbi:MAG: ABC transporter permease [Acutalibacteraceae bacterium]|jgi:putative ABC transport system permease protein|nr:ABC transporter permease [Acutalibacteraceae bacterium]